ncbi:MAG: hypothetical protein BGP06_01860 [Rhizobiales bacterium 65-9]|nr:hypothetical protein [Hyphomicrobiales bacterium]OJY33278.1 MAG: hypothetical protein BGP06_01860 [Rhizobiales bacterium 65-9]
MKHDPKQTSPERQQNAEIAHPTFGAIRMPAVAAATCVKPKAAKPREERRDLPPILRKEQFFD